MKKRVVKKTKKVIKKIVKKVSKTTKKKVIKTPGGDIPNIEFKKETPIHNANYWLNRPNNDKHLDWNLANNWIEDYWQSQNHPHRQLILETLRGLTPFDSLAELGCNCGPNLALINKTFPGKRLLGIDIEPRVIERAKDELREIAFWVGNITKLPWDTQSVDIVLADATFMYLDSSELKLALGEIERITKKAVIIVDRFDESSEGIRSGDVRARNYEKLLKDRGFRVEVKKLTNKEWPDGVGWKKLGYIFVATK